jgi:hypothetical protein
MSRQLDNLNPTIFDTPVASGSSRRPVAAKSLLWENDEELELPSSDEEREEIDAEEVYGMLCSRDSCFKRAE